jgi:hypothetical protein
MSEHFEYKSLSEIRIGTNETGISQAQEPEAFRLLRRWMLLALCLAVLCVTANLAFGQTTTLVAYGTTDIFHSSACYSFPAAVGQSVTFSSVTGLAGFGGPINGIYSTNGDGADPSLAGTTGVNLPPQGVFSGLQNIPGSVFFLTGVFVGPSTSVPPTYNFSGNTNFAEFSPLINQLFFIGDGLIGTGSGPQQVFHVPDAATGLCLGFGDGAYFSGAPTFGDNWGSLTATFTVSQCVNTGDVHPFPTGPDSGDHQPTEMHATFSPTNDGVPVDLESKAMACGYKHFDWQQTITTAPSDVVVYSVVSPHVPLQPQFLDPPPGGYTYQLYDSDIDYTPNAAYPFYYNVLAPNSYVLSLAFNSTDGILSFTDIPKDPTLPSGEDIEFKTSLVGVIGDFPGATASKPLYTWTWKSTFNGTTGEQRILSLNNQTPPDPGSGTGGTTITNINGAQLPEVLAPSKVTVTASGLAYSRVSQTFNGTLTLHNIGDSSISGPMQVVLFGINAGVALTNATNELSGTPYITLPNVAGLAAGRSAAVSVQFKKSSNSTINFTPVVYSGSIN